MGKRPAYTYKDPGRPWTRTAVKKTDEAYVKGVRDAVIRTFEMGERDKEDCDLRLDLESGENMQVRDEALESARIHANKILENEIGLESYFFKIRTYPHQCLRKHAMVMGAGADRISSGMRKSFGRPTGRAARLNENQKVMSIWVREENKDLAHKSLERADSKIPGSNSIKTNWL